jgi:hypothetical protein
MIISKIKRKGNGKPEPGFCVENAEMQRLSFGNALAFVLRRS